MDRTHFSLRSVIELVCGIKVEDLFDHADIIPVRGFEGIRFMELPIKKSGNPMRIRRSRKSMVNFLPMALAVI